jgi:hypothetical protein
MLVAVLHVTVIPVTAIPRADIQETATIEFPTRRTATEELDT